ncbi:hypothetical protein EMGBS15_17070 [Filimonas sp.]|jgi:hypothetical protein|nr:hypothetical protein EMGBS15_17070 [Filimonas sp.]
MKQLFSFVQVNRNHRIVSEMNVICMLGKLPIKYFIFIADDSSLCVALF